MIQVLKIYRVKDCPDVNSAIRGCKVKVYMKCDLFKPGYCCVYKINEYGMEEYGNWYLVKEIYLEE